MAISPWLAHFSTQDTASRNLRHRCRGNRRCSHSARARWLPPCDDMIEKARGRASGTSLELVGTRSNRANVARSEIAPDRARVIRLAR
ncbi:MAG: hypothetical protein QHD01_03075 [Bradyrhizobium sp.]|uniref:hypothetical protein n=1 Tax=Bradyrhizobium sp. TaxID=376 RepID=UPI0029AE835D|nr:hypothetical protein [Bradyrhizobium sp.]MDX3965563.1 hypothetical protein [Bradyrhizobium sp.]